MMEDWKPYILTVIICVLCCKMVTQIVSDTTKKGLIQYACGVILAITLLEPVTKLNLADFLYIPQQDWIGADKYIAEGKKAASKAKENSIKAALEAYILDKARELEMDIRVEVFLNENLFPQFVEITGEAEPNQVKQLGKILVADLGVPEEKQIWIWNQESN